MSSVTISVADGDPTTGRNEVSAGISSPASGEDTGGQAFIMKQWLAQSAQSAIKVPSADDDVEMTVDDINTKAGLVRSSSYAPACDDGKIEFSESTQPTSSPKKRDRGTGSTHDEEQATNEVDVSRRGSVLRKAVKQQLGRSAVSSKALLTVTSSGPTATDRDIEPVPAHVLSAPLNAAVSSSSSHGTEVADNDNVIITTMVGHAAFASAVPADGRMSQSSDAAPNLKLPMWLITHSNHLKSVTAAAVRWMSSTQETMTSRSDGVAASFAKQWSKRSEDQRCHPKPT
jgi:hypothetical protein